jgi:hypothetical protein
VFWRKTPNKINEKVGFCSPLYRDSWKPLATPLMRDLAARLQHRPAGFGAWTASLIAPTSCYSTAMPALTRRRDPDANQETWLIHYDDILVGSIAMRAGVPVDRDQWSWSVAFSPACDRGLRARGTAKSFDAARAAFDTAWQWLLPKFTEADFTEYRRHRAS